MYSAKVIGPLSDIRSCRCFSRGEEKTSGSSLSGGVVLSCDGLDEGLYRFDLSIETCLGMTWGLLDALLVLLLLLLALSSTGSLERIGVPLGGGWRTYERALVMEERTTDGLVRAKEGCESMEVRPRVADADDAFLRRREEAESILMFD
jgi:hypothetical protein